MIYGYARVSTAGQAKDGNSLAGQTDEILNKYPSADVVQEAYSGAKVRVKFEELIDKCHKGDLLVVTKLDRFCSATKEGLEYIDKLMNKGVSIHILNMGLIEDTPMGRMIITNLFAFAEFERAMIIERTQTGKAIAKQREGFTEGRPKKAEWTPELIEEVKSGKKSIRSACAELGVSRSSWYNAVKK